MYDTVNFNQFNDWFIKDNSNYKDNFSYEGRKALFDYLEELENDAFDTDNNPLGIAFDPIALCCEYSEYENIQEFWNDYDKEDYPTIDKIEDNTAVIKIQDSNKFIIQSF